MTSNKYSPKKMIVCPTCKGTGIQEERLKGFRRYKCANCEGTKIIKNYFWEMKQKEKKTTKKPTKQKTKQSSK